jgi:uncharacterized protein YdhG (YjbR/CyaY superfamily)
MDPIAIVSLAGFSAEIAKTAFDTGEALFNFAKEAKLVNQTVASLARQARAVKDPCDLIDAYLRGIEDDLTTQPALFRTRRARQFANILAAIERQLRDCKETLRQLRASTDDICNGDPVRGTRKRWAQSKLALSREAMNETRSRLALHMTALNTSLQLLTL